MGVTMCVIVCVCDVGVCVCVIRCECVLHSLCVCVCVSGCHSTFVCVAYRDRRALAVREKHTFSFFYCKRLFLK